MVRVAVYGASGYTGLELLKLLARHPQVEVTALTTRQDESPHLNEVHPSLTGAFDLRLENLSVDQVAERADAAFTCLPHAASAEVVKDLLERGLKVVDLSADYRIDDRAVYEEWYRVTHPDPARLGQTPYGLPELFREQLAGAKLVANPGCYPTATVLGLAPLLEAGLIEPAGIVVDAKSGVSGAGRNPKPNLHFPEANESCCAYGVGGHRHTPEIDQVLNKIGARRASTGAEGQGGAVEVVFTPHLIPMDRGMLATCYAAPAGEVTTDQLQDCLRSFYADEPFVYVTDAAPRTKDVSGTNRCHVHAVRVRGRVVVLSVIDNLLKGASGAAVQNFNLMHGVDETTSLL